MKTCCPGGELCFSFVLAAIHIWRDGGQYHSQLEPFPDLLALFATNSQTVDDAYEHTIMVMRDQRTGRMRLLTVVADGELEQCPVWTAFGT